MRIHLNLAARLSNYVGPSHSDYKVTQSETQHRRGNCHDNAVAENFFSLLKRERIRRRTYKTKEEARSDVFDYIEMYYNPNRKHANNRMLSPVEFEKQQKLKPQGV